MDGVPGFVPRVLRDPGVTLFRADGRVFEAMVDGWRTQMLARGLAVDTIKPRTRVVERFQLFSGEYPWMWRPVDIEDYLAELRSRERPIGLGTLRSYSNAVAMFCAYLTHPGYGWGEFCERTFGDVPAQICFDWNTPRHTTDDAVPPARRSFTRAELQRLFDYVDDVVDREYAAGSKRWLPALRDSIAFKVCYAYGMRRREITMLDLEDFGPNPPFQVRSLRRDDGAVGQGHDCLRATSPNGPDGPRVRMGRGPARVLGHRGRPEPVPDR